MAAKYPQISKDPEVQKRYEQMRKAGESHKMAEMLALQKAPPVEDRYSPMHPRRGRGQGRNFEKWPK